MEKDQIIQLVIFGAFVVLKLIIDALKKKPQQQPKSSPKPLPEAGPEPEAGLPPARPDGPPDIDLDDLFGDYDDEPVVVDVAETDQDRRRFLAALDALAKSSDDLLASARITLATRRVAAVLEDYVAPRLGALRKEVATTPGLEPSWWERLGALEMIVAVVETMIRQRRRQPLGRSLGDADAMAMACYQPIVEFASANQVPLTSATPVTLQTPFDLSLWTGFVPTGVAPLFLPRDFFDRVAWWPALAHEIGHDFLVATGDASDRLREQLGLVSQEVGQRPILLTHQGIALRDIERVFGCWFEELFADVFGTLMVGPAYGLSMIELFATTGYPLGVASVALNGDRSGYDTHPPRHLRVLLSAHVLELCDEDEVAATVRKEWQALHGEIAGIRFPVAPTGAIGVPIEPLLEIATGLADKLCASRLLAFDSHSLYDIPGVGWGPYEKAGSRRARAELMAGRPPSAESARAVIAGAVMASRRRRKKEKKIINLARRAIVGVTEHREDAYSSGLAAGGAAGDVRSAAGLREAFVLHTMLAAPPSLRRVRRDPGGLISDRRWRRRWG